MKIIEVQPAAWTVRYKNARSGGGVYTAELPVHEGRVDALPDALDVLVVTSDLQGRVGGRLLGEALAEILAERVAADRTGVLLAGDLYAAPGADVRGASGPVDRVWWAFAERFRWVSGVAGNHDEVEHPDVLDGACVDRDGLRVGGVGGIIGNPRRLHRRSEPDHVEAIGAVLAEDPDVLVLHDPPLGGAGQRGNALIRDAVDGARALVVCGHAHWEPPLAALSAGTQVLNADGRVFLLRR